MPSIPPKSSITTSNQEGIKTSFGTSSLFAYAVGVVMAIAIVYIWLIAPWLTAHNMIRLMTERSSSWLAILVVIICGDHYTRRLQRGSGVWKRILTWFVVIFLLLLSLLGRAHSTQAFFYWKARVMPKEKWAQMASDLQKAGKISADAGGNRIKFRDLPESVHHVGRDEDFAGGYVASISGDTHDGLITYVMYGNRLRTWGFCVISDKSLEERIPARESWAIEVAPDAYLFLYDGTGS